MCYYTLAFKNACIIFGGNVLLLLHTFLFKPDLKYDLSIATFQALYLLSFEFLLQGIIIVIH